jgi:2-isopropylmalate synthase
MFQADSCAIAAVRAGADEVKTTPYGNSTVSLKRFVKILDAKSDLCKARCDVRVIDLDRTVERIKILCEARSSKSSKPLEGLDIDRDALTLTRHDDREAVLKVVSKLGYELGEEDAARVYEAFVRVASKSESVEAKELDAIVASVAYQVPPTYRLESYVINSGNIISATCHLRLRKGDGVLESVCVGDGPVDAAFQAVDKVVGRQYELDDFQIRSVAEGREALGETVVRLRYEDRIYSGRGVSRDIVGSSLMAYLNAVNKMAYEEGEV